MRRIPSFRITLLLSLMCCTLLFVACTSKKPALSKIQGFAQGTTYQITFDLPADVELSKVQNAVSEELKRIDLALSNYRDDSKIEAFNQQKSTEPVEVEHELVSLVETARKLYQASNGCYDLTIKPLFVLWGFKKDVFTPASPDAIREILDSIGLDKIETLSPTKLRKTIPEITIDVSSIGQGYSVERIADLLEEFGINRYLVEIGGELKIRGHKLDGSPWRIALEKPLPGERKMQKIVSFDDGKPMSLVSSGTYRHFFDQDGKRYSHILDARTGAPVEHQTVSVAILHESATLGDAWSTTLLCLGSEEGLKVANQHGLAALFIDDIDGKLIERNSRAFENLQGISFPEK